MVYVSTHSRLKAAGFSAHYKDFPDRGFNTQPPEGGWYWRNNPKNTARGFNTQPPEGGWQRYIDTLISYESFNTQPPEGGW